MPEQDDKGRYSSAPPERAVPSSIITAGGAEGLKPVGEADDTGKSAAAAGPAEGLTDTQRLNAGRVKFTLSLEDDGRTGPGVPAPNQIETGIDSQAP